MFNLYFICTHQLIFHYTCVFGIVYKTLSLYGHIGSGSRCQAMYISEWRELGGTFQQYYRYDQSTDEGKTFQ